MADPFLGMVIPVAFSYAPEDWAICSGQLLTVNQNQALYSIMGTTYGGSAPVNFNLPNLQTRTIVGYGQATYPSGVQTLPIGSYGGDPVTQLSLTQLPTHTHQATFTGTGGGGGGSQSPVASGTVSLPFSVNASLTVTADAKVASSTATGGSQTPSNNAVLGKAGGPPGAIYTASSNTPDSVIGPAGAVTGTATGTIAGNAEGQVSLPVTGSTGGITGGTVTVSPAGLGAPFSNMAPYVAMNYLIALQGLYPVRP